MTFFLRTSCLLPLTLALGCGGASKGSGADASTDSSPTREAAGPDVGNGLPPPSDDCRYIDDNGVTCDSAYYLSGAQLYTCGHLTTMDANDAGIASPFAPPLPSNVDCRNVASPVLDAGLAAQLGSLWCCLGADSLCARAAAIDPACKTGTVALSCPSVGPVFPPGTRDGGACTPLGGYPDASDGLDAGDGGDEIFEASVPDTGLTLTPPQPSSETFWCCSP